MLKYNTKERRVFAMEAFIDFFHHGTSLATEKTPLVHIGESLYSALLILMASLQLETFV